MEEAKPLTIVQLTVSNVKRLRAVTIRPDGRVVVLGGKNGAGKTSVLDAITYALAGERSVCREPVRRGEERAEVDLDLGEFRVHRTFTAGGGTLTVTSADGARYSSPQAMLNRITGEHSFDPLAFAAMESGRQAETLRRLLGLNFTAADADRAEAFADRTAVNRECAALRARLDAAPQHQDAPPAEQSTADVLTEQDAAVRSHEAERARVREVNRANAAARVVARDAERDLSDARRVRADAGSSVLEAEREVARWTAALEDRRLAFSEADRVVEEKALASATVSVAAGALRDEPEPTLYLAPFRARLAAVEAVNAKVRANQARDAMEAEVKERRAESATLTGIIQELDAGKAATIAAAEMPVDGLGFDPAGVVTFRGLPLDQASHAERLRVSVAIGLALNPRLRVLLVRDASLLDEDGMRLVAEMAEAAGAQVWLERVGQDERTTVLIEDGAVVGEP